MTAQLPNNRLFIGYGLAPVYFLQITEKTKICQVFLSFFDVFFCVIIKYVDNLYDNLFIL